VTQDPLWAPWRSEYIVTAKQDENPPGCFICRYLGEANDQENLIVRRCEHSVILLNRFPYNNGHLLVAPLSHKASLSDLTDTEMLEIQQQLRLMIDALQAIFKPDGFNVGLNLGKVAGAGLPGHVHWHIVPRWNGDTNFMTVCADTRVISQSLAQLYRLLAEQLAKCPS
jgi:ATP adenylyltransferase